MKIGKALVSQRVLKTIGRLWIWTTTTNAVDIVSSSTSIILTTIRNLAKVEIGGNETFTLCSIANVVSESSRISLLLEFLLRTPFFRPRFETMLSNRSFSFSTVDYIK